MPLPEPVDSPATSPQNYLTGMAIRDTTNVAVFQGSSRSTSRTTTAPTPNHGFPNFVVMSMPEDHTRGTRLPARFHAAGDGGERRLCDRQLVERSPTAPTAPRSAIFIIEDDGQDGPTMSTRGARSAW